MNSCFNRPQVRSFALVLIVAIASHGLICGEDDVQPMPLEVHGAAESLGLSEIAERQLADVDVAFDHFISATLISKALDSHDPVLLADCTMLLAEGERVLGRSHKSGATADGLFRIAVIVTTELRDHDTLKRLTGYVAASGKKELKTLLTRSENVLSESKEGQRQIQIPLATHAVPLSRAKSLHTKLLTARILGDHDLLADVEDAINGDDSLPPSTIKALKDKCADVKTSIAGSDDKMTVDVLRKLKGAVRWQLPGTANTPFDPNTWGPATKTPFDPNTWVFPANEPTIFVGQPNPVSYQLTYFEYALPGGNGCFSAAGVGRNRPWIEFKYGKEYARFTEVLRGAGHVVLYDSNRNIYIALTSDNQALVSAGNYGWHRIAGIAIAKHN